MNKCPRCTSEDIISGTLSGSDGQPSHFSPKNQKWWKRLISVHMVPLAQRWEFNACPECGLVWNEVDPFKLKQLILQNVDHEEK